MMSQDGYYVVKVKVLAYQIKMDFLLSCSLRKKMKFFSKIRFRVYFKSSVEQISLEYKLNGNNH